MARNLYEAFVEREVVSDGVLPPLLVVAIVRKVLQKVNNRINQNGQILLFSSVVILSLLI